MSLNKFTNNSQKDWLIINASSLICKDGVKTSINQQHTFKPPSSQSQEHHNNYLVYNHVLQETEWRPINNLETYDIIINNNTITDYYIFNSYNYFIDIIDPNFIINIILDEKNKGSILNFILKIKNNLNFIINFVYKSNIIYTKNYNINITKYYNLLFLKDDETYILY